MTTIEELDRRVKALEAAQKHTAETQEWMAGTLGRIAAVQDRHTKTLEDHTQRLERLESDVREIRTDLKRPAFRPARHCRGNDARSLA
jgi:hypothetical protein